MGVCGGEAENEQLAWTHGTYDAATAPDKAATRYGRFSNIAISSTCSSVAYLHQGVSYFFSTSTISSTVPRNRHLFSLTMPPAKRQKLSDEESLDLEHDEEMLSGSEQDGFSSDADSESGDSEPDTEDEIAEAKLAKSKKTSKRKRRATDAVNFGTTLQSLLTTNAPAAPLSLKPSIAKKRKEEKLEAKGKHVLQIERKEKEDRGRITDVIGGWGGESERALRKVAQRGGLSHYLYPISHGY